MKKIQAFARIRKAKPDSEIYIGEFPRDLKCDLCKHLKRHLYVFLETGIRLELCATCYNTVSATFRIAELEEDLAEKALLKV